ncbi:stage II sporulation protein R [Bacillus ginsengihumi]|uniref:Stage II sporulation protein R n=1 Tax=Heyndrickxia ginsengihumi TaxID=363870 RepID=A0A6M0P3C9_9BACI|nr:stage II sporulation protein R [Heyndrickxia ginsengihumi]
MKRKSTVRLYILLLSIGTILSLYLPKQEVVAKDSVVIPKDAIRLRILANSDKPQDQAVKRKIRDAVNANISKWVKNIKSKQEAKQVIQSHLPEIEKIATKVMHKEHMNQSVHVTLGKVDFPTKLYGQYLYPAGKYDAVLITLGEGKGANWWCVLYPPLCFLDFSNGLAVSKGFEDDSNEEKHHTQETKKTQQKNKKVQDTEQTQANEQSGGTEQAGKGQQHRETDQSQASEQSTETDQSQESQQNTGAEQTQANEQHTETNQSQESQQSTEREQAQADQQNAGTEQPQENQQSQETDQVQAQQSKENQQSKTEQQQNSAKHSNSSTDDGVKKSSSVALNKTERNTKKKEVSKSNAQSPVYNDQDEGEIQKKMLIVEVIKHLF